ncbi:hypothetical protein LTR95_000394 [Oleoguttula sp. CCFEE 5521]
MSVVGEVVGIVACVAALVSAYRDSGVIIDKIKLKRAARRAAPPSRLLEDSIDQAPEDIEREKQRGVNRFGKAFEHGDHIAVIALQQITIELQSSLLFELKNAAYDDAATDFFRLVDVSDSGRDKSIDTLIQFRQRLLAAEPIKELQPVTQVVTLPPPLVEKQTQKALPSPGTELRHAPTWSTGASTAVSRDISGDEDTASGAESSHTAKKRQHSLFGFLKHQRVPSSVRTPSISTMHEEPRRMSHASTSPTSTPSMQPVQIKDNRAPSFTYEEWEDDPGKIWGNAPPEHRESVVTMVSASPPNSTFSMDSQRMSRVPTLVRNSSVSIPAPTQENEYLGYCKSAARLQNGDKKAFSKESEAVYAYSRSAYSQPQNQYLKCASTKCCFRSHMRIDLIWDKVWVDSNKGLKFRWTFLAKSHVSQKVVKEKQYVFQCLFCVYAGESTPVFHGTNIYLEHVAEHRGPMGEVILYKAGCINDRIAEDNEAFDINLYPPTDPDGMVRRGTHMLSDDMMALTMKERAESVHDSVMGANEPWNAGLSDFHYGGGMDRAELE